MASDKAKELWLRMQFTHGNREDEFDAAVAPLLDLLDEYRLEEPKISWAETTDRARALFSAWGRG